MLRDWNMESGSMGRFYYQLAVGTIGPKVRMGERCTKARGQDIVKRKYGIKYPQIHQYHTFISLIGLHYEFLLFGTGKKKGHAQHNFCFFYGHIMSDI